MIAYSVEGQSSPYKVQLFSMRDSHEEELEDTVSELLSNLEHMIFQFSSDGKKILFKQTLTASYGQADRRIAYLGAQDYGTHVVTDLNIRCGNYPKWHPAGDLIVYHISYCGRSAPGGVLGIISMDGSKHQVLLPDNNDNPANFAISRDGSAIAILPLTNGKSYGEIADFYMLNLQSMSEDRAIFPRHGNPPDSFTPLQHEKNGTPINQIQCRNENHMLIQKYDGSPACFKPETKEKLIERGWANINTDNIRQTVSLPSPPDPMSIAITGNDKLPIFTIKRGETKEIGILLEPKIPITFATVSVDSYFGSAGDCNNISTDSYCPGRGIIMNLSETEITAKKEITLTITIPENMTVGTYGYQIETKTTFDMSSVEKPRTIGNSVRFDLKVI